MATPKRYCWLKLRSTFMTSDTVDFLMSQKNGASYVVLYQMLCLHAINNGGKLCCTIGNSVIPYDADKIQRECKWFPIATVRRALEMYSQIGLIAERDGIMEIVGIDDMVGSETEWAVQKRARRTSHGGHSLDNVHPDEADKEADNVRLEIRDKEIRDKEIREREIREKESIVVVGNPYMEDAGNSSNNRPNFDTLEAYIGNWLPRLTPLNFEELLSYRDELPDDVIRHAVDEANAQNKMHYGYVKAILDRYIHDGLKTLGDVRACESKYRKEGDTTNAKHRGYPESDPRQVGCGETVL